MTKIVDFNQKRIFFSCLLFLHQSLGNFIKLKLKINEAIFSYYSIIFEWIVWTKYSNSLYISKPRFVKRIEANLNRSGQHLTPRNFFYVAFYKDKLFLYPYFFLCKSRWDFSVYYLGRKNVYISDEKSGQEIIRIKFNKENVNCWQLSKQDLGESEIIYRTLNTRKHRAGVHLATRDRGIHCIQSLIMNDPLWGQKYLA